MKLLLEYVALEDITATILLFKYWWMVFPILRPYIIKSINMDILLVLIFWEMVPPVTQAGRELSM